VVIRFPPQTDPHPRQFFAQRLDFGESNSSNFFFYKDLSFVLPGFFREKVVVVQDIRSPYFVFFFLFRFFVGFSELYRAIFRGKTAGEKFRQKE